MVAPNANDLDPLVEVHPMMTSYEADAGAGREQMVLRPEGTFVSYRANVVPGQLRVGGEFTTPVKEFTPWHTERNFPREGGLPFPAEEDPLMPYRTRQETFKSVDYLDVKAEFGKDRWPAKRLFPEVPTVTKVESTEHDIVPVQSHDTKVESQEYTVVDLDGLPERESMTTFAAVDEEVGVEADFEALEGLSQEDIEEAENLGQLKKVAAWVGNAVAKAVQDVINLARAGRIRSEDEARQWLRLRFESIRRKRIARLNSMIEYGLKQAESRAIPEVAKVLGKGERRKALERGVPGLVRQPLKPHGRDEALSTFVTSEDLRDGTVALGQDEDDDENDDEGTEEALGFLRRKRRGLARRFGPRSLVPRHGPFPFREGGIGALSHVDSDDEGLGQTTAALTPTQTKSVTDVVVGQIAAGNLTTAGAVAGAIDLAARTALQQQQLKIERERRRAAEAMGVRTTPTVVERIRETLMPSDKPFYTRPLFIAGALALLAGVGYLVFKGDSGPRYRRRRRR